MSSILSPPYSPAVGVPAYSVAPRSDEHTLDRGSTRIGAPGSSRTSAFFRMKTNIGLEIYNQPDSGIDDPVVAGGSLLSGNVLVEDTQSITTVEIQLDGWMESRTLGLGSSNTRTVDETVSLYRATQGTICPSNLAFCLRFPSTFSQNNKSYRLPPSCDFEIQPPKFLKFKCTYSLTVIVTSNSRRQSMTSLFRKGKRMSVLLNFRQRSLPYVPPISNPSFMRTVKSCPEEWLQLPISIPARASQFVTILCDLYVPRRSVFRIEGTIPFYIQMTGPMDSLREVFIDKQPKPEIFTNSSPETPTAVRVFILRQVRVDIGTNVENTRRIVLGEGSSVSVPPAIEDWVQRSPHLSSSETVNWSGELRCQEEQLVESFETAYISIFDFIAIEILPRHSASFGQARFGHSIKLTSDTALSLQ
ncbi:hypothetical protein C8R44DRAFT_774503 [Mycena epipterygia]|nr:hypothetical protein C8R44DRAFT_774503 [Mycena epipterygia]